MRLSVFLGCLAAAFLAGLAARRAPRRLPTRGPCGSRAAASRH